MPEDNKLKEKFKTAGRKFKTLAEKQRGVADSKPPEETTDGQSFARGQEKEQRQVPDSSSFGQPLRQTYGESDREFRARQQKHDQVMEQQAQAQKAKKEREKAGEDLMNNAKSAETISKAQQAKQEFEERILRFKEKVKSEPIKQMPGESDLAFRRRQQKEDDENPDNIKDRNVGNVLKERGKNEIAKGVRRGTDAVLKSSPKLAAATKQARETAEEIRKRREKINKMIKERTEKINKRLAALQKRYKAATMVKNKIKEEAERIAMEVVKAAAKAAAQALISAISAAVGTVSGTASLVIIAVLAVIVIIVYECNNGGLIGTACSAASTFGGLFL